VNAKKTCRHGTIIDLYCGVCSAEKDQRIAALEAENERLLDEPRDLRNALDIVTGMRDQARGELAALKEENLKLISECGRRSNALAASHEELAALKAQHETDIGISDHYAAELANSNERFASLARRVTTFLGADADAREKLLGGLHIDFDRAARAEEGSE